MKKVIITGGTGAVGYALVKFLSGRGIKVTVAVRPGSGRKQSITGIKNVKVVDCPVEDIERLPDMIKGKYDTFFHLAWAYAGKKTRNNRGLQKKNLEYTLKAVKTAKKMGCCAFIGTGSQAEYARSNRAIKEDDKTEPEFAGGTVKLAAGRLAAALCRQLGIRFIWARIFSVYGPNDGENTMIMYCIRQLLNNKRPGLTKCAQIWDYLYSTDAARALWLLADKGVDQNVYNIGGGKGYPLVKYVKTLRDAIDPKLSLGFGEIKYGDNQVMYLKADISKIKNDTGFQPLIPFKQGITETIEWCRKNIPEKRPR